MFTISIDYSNLHFIQPKSMKEGSTIACSILLLGDMSKINAEYRVVKCFTYL